MDLLQIQKKSEYLELTHKMVVMMTLINKKVTKKKN